MVRAVMPLTKMICRSEDTNIYFRGYTKDGRPKYEMVEKATGKSRMLIISKQSYAAMNKVMRKYPNVLERLGNGE